MIAPPPNMPITEAGRRDTTWRNWFYNLFTRTKDTPGYVTEYGAVGDGVNDDSSAIQAAIDAAEAVPGQTILVPPGAYNLGTTGITITGDGVLLEGLSPRFVGAALFGVEFLYSGTGAAVTFGSGAKSAHYRNSIANIQIRATGDAITSGTAIGLKLVNQHYFRDDRIAVKDFQSGIGMQLTASGTGNYSATCMHFDILMHQNNIGVQAVGSSAIIKPNADTFIGGAVIGFGTPPAGSIGVDLKQYSDGFTFYNLDVESFETGIAVDGTSHKFLGSRTEFNTSVAFDVTANAVRTHIIAHQFAGTALLSEKISDAGQLTYMIQEDGIYNPPVIRPIADKTELFHIINEAGDTVLDVSTDPSDSIDVPNGVPVQFWSDAFSTLVAKIYGDSGIIQGTQIRATAAVSDPGTGVAIGGTTETTVGAAGGASALPATPLGYIKCYVGSTAVKIPYYNN